MNEQTGEVVLRRAVDQAAACWGDRLTAAYALGSLAHGGFDPLVSDVDLGLILADPLEPADADRAADLAAHVQADGAPLADRLSVFWGTPATLRGEVAGGRFPPLDRLDLLQYGRLLAGREARSGLPAPDRRELISAAVEFALRSLSGPDVLAELADPAGLVAAGPRRLTKRILFPVRFLYTARTGEIGRNHDAVAHFAAHEPGPAADLATAALAWRREPPAPGEAGAIALVAAGLRPIYRCFLDDHEPRLRNYQQPDLANRLAAWRDRLETGC